MILQCTSASVVPGTLPHVPEHFTASLFAAGELCIETAPLGGQPAPPAGVQQLRCSSLHLADTSANLPVGAGTPAAPVQQLLSAQLAWQLRAGASPRCYHVWCSFAGTGTSGSGGSGGSGGSWGGTSAPQWLGAACASSYCVSDLPVPAGATEVQFVVQPEACNGQVQDLQEAARVAATLPPSGA